MQRVDDYRLCSAATVSQSLTEPTATVSHTIHPPTHTSQKESGVIGVGEKRKCDCANGEGDITSFIFNFKF